MSYGQASVYHCHFISPAHFATFYVHFATFYLTVFTVNIQTYRNEQTVQTKTSLLLIKHPDLGIHCLSIQLNIFRHKVTDQVVKLTCSNLRIIVYFIT